MDIVFYVYVALLAVMSLVAFCSYKKDKELAKNRSYRTPEKTLLLMAACFGGIGAFAGMKVFHHKTRHLRFQIIVPLCMIVQLALLGFLCYLAFVK